MTALRSAVKDVKNSTQGYSQKCDSEKCLKILRFLFWIQSGLVFRQAAKKKTN